MAANKENNILDEKGQSLFELIAFLPLLLLLISVMVTTGNAINGSINQQKALRGYFYFLVRGSSVAGMSTSQLATFDEEGLSSVGQYVVGWRASDDSINDTFGTCYKYNSLFNNSEIVDRDCKDPSVRDGKTHFIRVFTAHGLCSENYEKRNGFYEVNHFNKGQQSCSLGQ